jgi:D-beta-D-heptose 7-phosphate kinase/D-beta-D-heptose 1-phosphate adenosyltransferase
MKPERLQQILQGAADKRFLVIGDLMLDEFVWGKVGRISPEAPVPVVEVTKEESFPGGAANVARNLRQFVENVAVIGMIGQDQGGERLRGLLAREKIDMSDAIEDQSFRTIVKTRIIAQHQQVVRVDRERITSTSPEKVGEIVRLVRDRLPEVDAVIFEDYGKGFLTNELVAGVCQAANAAGKIVAADPNPRRSIDWPGITVATPNRSEAFLAAGMALCDSAASPSEDVDLARAGEALLKKWNSKLLLITLGEQGMMLFQKDDKPHHVPTKARQVFDVSGAGDTAIAMFTLALCCGATPVEAAEIANHASAVVIGKLGTATVTREELFSNFREDVQRG